MAGTGEYRIRVRNRALRDQLVAPFQRFAEGEANSGLLLLFCAVVALAWANLGPAGHYAHFWEQPFPVAIGQISKVLTLREWINDGLMTLFFLHVGLEIKREFLIGELSDRSVALFPVIAAVGGMAAPALIFAALNPQHATGAGVPMATDIAFSLGILALLGARIPTGVKVFLTAVAIVDDLGGVAVIAIFYGHGLNGPALLGVGICLTFLASINLIGVRSLFPFLLIGFFLWIAVLNSGIHATVAGVLLALTIPSGTCVDLRQFSSELRESLSEFAGTAPISLDKMTESRAAAIRRVGHAIQLVTMPLEQLERRLANWVIYGVVPIFALANAGIDLGGTGPLFRTSIELGIFAGLVFGKPIGIIGASVFANRVLRLKLPTRMTWTVLGGVGLLGGIGFTMSLFIAHLAFGDTIDHERAKAAILLASLVSGVAGYAWLARVTRTKPQTPTVPQ
jgi:Na+:H+ antiporter, NhaA family